MRIGVPRELLHLLQDAAQAAKVGYTLLVKPFTRHGVDYTSEPYRDATGWAAHPFHTSRMSLRVADIIELTQVMIASTGGWQSMVVADHGRGPVGLVQLGEAFAAMTPEVVEFAERFYGEGFLEFLGPRLAAMGRVQATYPPDCLLIAEIHVAPQHRGAGIGNSLLGSVVERALAEGVRLLGLQTLTSNPARSVFETWGFNVADTRTDLHFEEYSGAAGYHLMLRHL